MQLQTIPADLSKYYPVNDYYSFHQTITLEKPDFWRRIHASYFLESKYRLIGKLLRFDKKLPPYLEWMKTPRVGFHDKVLDVGAGNGKLLVDLYKYGFTNLTGIDPFIEKDIAYDAINIYKKSIFHLVGQFDYIMLHHSFEHMDEPEKVLLQLNRLLKDGKYLLIRMPVMGNYGWNTYGTDWAPLDAPRHLIIHTEKSMGILAAKTGFEIKKVVYDDEEAFSIWASEQYKVDIPLQDKQRSWGHNTVGSIFSKEQMAAFVKLSEDLKKRGQGDQAAFYLYKTGSPEL